MLSSSQFRLHLIVFLWGFTAILGKLIEVDAMVLVFYRTLLACGFLYFFIRFIKKQSLAVRKKTLLQLLAIGGVLGFHWLAFFTSIKIANVSIALSCLSLVTLFVSIIEPIVFKRKIDMVELIIGLVIVACISLIFNTEIQHKEGIIYGIICAFLGAIFTTLNGKMFGKASSENVIFYEMLGGWGIVALFMLFAGDITTVAQLDTYNTVLLLVLASLFTAYPMLESIKLMEYISPFTLALTVNLEPVYGIILAFFIFGQSEHMSPIFYIASLVMILAIVVNGIIKARRKKQ
ncbi:DMT family transporter [Elizabethkingia sp. JS20170427COW]|uniref:DMT family transporter n=1 Tax=Elizabethkingia sp. JS20170427COW TaxID=2583851 RepID=UPI00110FF94A|nr:DMT family transporter [Elizabethkingia sp. JS20170427COW]QCX53485.1 DMT family transporter [Elizabethkingia sp. JS20170427COW]